MRSRGSGCSPRFDRRRALLWLGLSCVAAPQALTIGCRSAGGAQRVNLPPPSERGAVGPGDTFTLEIMGEKDLPKEYTVAADGTVDFPFVHTIQVAGLEASEISRLVRDRLIEQKILSEPTVVIQVKEYRSRRVVVLGQVVKPGAFPYIQTMTLIQAISMAGGLTPIADDDRVNITRKADNGKVYTAVLSVGVIMEGRSPDIPLQSGDQIFVYERLF